MYFLLKLQLGIMLAFYDFMNIISLIEELSNILKLSFLLRGLNAPQRRMMLSPRESKVAFLFSINCSKSHHNLVCVIGDPGISGLCWLFENRRTIEKNQ